MSYHQLFEGIKQMRLTLVAATLAALMMTACGKPNQALPEQEKENFSKITSQQGAPSAPAPEAGAPASEAPDASEGK
jgi:hypothetical protein